MVALAHPEWLARRRGPAPSPGTEAVYASVGGVGLRLPAASALASCQWLAVADVDRAPGRAEALVRAAVPVDEALALEVAGAWLVEDTRTRWESGRLRSERLRRLGAITLTTAPGPSPSPREAAAAVTRAVAEQGLGILPWSARARQLRGRLDLLHRTLGAPWPDVSPEALTEQAGQWLAPAVTSLAASARRPDLSRLDVTAALRTLLPWPEASRLDELAPERLQVPSGSQVPLSYAQDDGGAGTPLERPVLAVRVQECFGWDATPRVVGGRVAVLIHLLSPALVLGRALPAGARRAAGALSAARLAAGSLGGARHPGDRATSGLLRGPTPPDVGTYATSAQRAFSRILRPPAAGTYAGTRLVARRIATAPPGRGNLRSMPCPVATVARRLPGRGDLCGHRCTNLVETVPPAAGTYEAARTLLSPQCRRGGPRRRPARGQCRRAR